MVAHSFAKDLLSRAGLIPLESLCIDFICCSVILSQVFFTFSCASSSSSSSTLLAVFADVAAASVLFWLFFCSVPCLSLSLFLSFLVIILVPAAYCMRQTYCMCLFKIAAFSALFSLALFASDGSEEEGPQVLPHSQLEWQTLRIHNSHRDRATLSRGLPEAAQLKDFFCGISGRCHESLLLLAETPSCFSKVLAGAGIANHMKLHSSLPLSFPGFFTSRFAVAQISLGTPWPKHRRQHHQHHQTWLALHFALSPHTFLLLPLFRLIPVDTAGMNTHHSLRFPPFGSMHTCNYL